MKLLAWLIVFLAISATLLPLSVRAEDIEDDDEVVVDDDEEVAGTDDVAVEEADDDEEDSDDDATLTPSADVSTAYIFPAYSEKRLELGEKITLLVVVSNTGLSTFNLTGMACHLHSQFDFTYYIQNFSYREPDTLLEPGRQVSLEYIFRPDKSLEPLQFWFSGYVDYNDTEGNMFRSTFINGTVELIEKEVPYNLQGFFMLLLTLAIVAVVAVFALKSFGFFDKSRKPAKAAERGTATATESSEWGSAYEQRKGPAKRVISNKRSGKKKAAPKSE